MVEFRRSLVVVALLHAVYASSPLVAWSSLTTDLLPASFSSSKSNAFFDRWTNDDEACQLDAVIFVNQPGLHVSDLRTLSPSSAIPKMLEAAPSSIQLPSVQLQASQSLESIANELAKRCGSRVLGSVAEAKLLHSEEIEGQKFVVNVEVPALPISGSRKVQMAAVGEQLAGELEGLTSAFPHHLIVYSDWQQSSHVPVASLASRQEQLSPSSSAGGILKHYQLLSPGLILSLFLVFFVLLPIVMVGIQALSSIQSPVRLDGKMLAEYRQKKNQ